jgi:hypothetical protein
MQILPNAKSQFIDQNGLPLASGSVGFYFPGTLNPKATFQDPAGTIANTNPVLLDSRGQALIWGSGVYRQIVKDAAGVTIWDQITEDPNSALTGNITDVRFVAGTDFTPGVSTQLTLPVTPGSISNMWVFFDASYQADDQIQSLDGATINFVSPIPVGVQEVNVKVGTTIAIGTPGDGTVGDKQLAWGLPLRRNFSSIALLRAVNNANYVSAYVEGYYAPSDGGGGSYDVSSTDTTSADNGGSIIVDTLGRRWHLNQASPLRLRQFGAKGDWVVSTATGTDDSTAFNNAVAAAQASLNQTLFIDAGNFYLPSAGTMTGRLFLKGNSDGMLVGNLLYQDLLFPPSADTATPLTNVAPFFYVEGVNFSTYGTSTGAFALTVAAQVATSFIDCFEMKSARFYGLNGLLAQNIISVTIDNCWFYSNINGVIASGCTNWSVSNTRFRQQVGFGFAQNLYSVNPAREGGENVRFVNCEWTVCATGVLLQQSQWARFVNCLFDYCNLPINVDGSKYVRCINTYFGVSIQSSLTTNPNYIAPPVSGCAFYAHGHDDTNLFDAGIDCVECEFVTYVGTSQPLVTCEGASSAFPSGYGLSFANFTNCLFLATTSHTMPSMLLIDKCQIVRMSNNIFWSFNQSTSMTGPYNISNVTSYQITGTETLLCQQSSVQMQPTNEKAAFNELDVYYGSSLKSVQYGAADSGGSGFRTLRITN